MRFPLLLACLLFALSVSPARAAIVVDFDAGSTDLTNNFAGNGQSLPTWVSSGGVNNTGSLVVTAARDPGRERVFRRYRVHPDHLDILSPEQSAAEQPGGRAPARYIVDDTTTNVATASAHLGGRLDTNGTNTVFRYQIRNNNASILPSGNFSLSTGIWYQMAVTFLNVDDTNINVAVELYDRGASGTASPTLVGGNASYSANTTNAVLTADSSVYGAFRVPRGDNVDQLDNFSFVNAVPEPGSAGLVALRRRSLR